jgi:hypothetical protein
VNIVPKVNIVILSHHYGNFLLWAICIQNEPPPILEMAGEQPILTPNTLTSSPDNVARYIRNTEVDEAREDGLGQARLLIEATQVEDEPDEWKRQDYALEALKKLAEECLPD